MTTRTAEYKFTDEQIIDAIKGSCGIITNVAENLGVSWDTANKRVKNGSEEVKRAFLDETERVIDKAESNVFEALEQKDLQMSKWVLATIGKRRGYSEKTEVEHSGGIKIVYLDKDDECL